MGNKEGHDEVRLTSQGPHTEPEPPSDENARSSLSCYGLRFVLCFEL